MLLNTILLLVFPPQAFKNVKTLLALAGWLRCLECPPEEHRKVALWSRQGRYLSCGFHPQQGHLGLGRQPIDVSLSRPRSSLSLSFSLSLPLSLSLPPCLSKINKHILGWGFEKYQWWRKLKCKNHSYLILSERNRNKPRADLGWLPSVLRDR